MSQLSEVKIKEEGLTVPSVVSELDKPIVTLADGWVSKTTVKVSVPPASVVVKLEVGLTVMPAVSSSTLVTETSLASKLS